MYYAICVIISDQRRCLRGLHDDYYEEYNFYGSIHRSRRKHGLNYRISQGWFTVFACLAIILIILLIFSLKKISICIIIVHFNVEMYMS